MRNIVQGITGFVLGLGLCAAPVLAAGQAKDRVVGIDPRLPTTIIGTSFLLGSEFPPGATIVANSNVLRGTLTRDAGTGDFLFSPIGDFWTLGTDRFTYTVQHPTTGELTIGVVVLVGETPALRDSVENFHDPLMTGSVWGLEEVEGSADIVTELLRILGTVAEPNEAEANVHRSNFSSSNHGLAQGGKANGTGGSPPPQPPPPPGSTRVLPPMSFTLMQGANFNGTAPFWVELRPDDTGDDVRLAWRDNLGNTNYGTWTWVGPSPHEYEINWWEDGPEPGVLLWVDGRLVADQEVESIAGVDRFEIGVLTPHPVTSPGLLIDDVELFAWGDPLTSPVPGLRAEVPIIESLEDGSANPAVFSGAVHVSSMNVLQGAHDLVFDAVQGATAKAEWSQIATENPFIRWNARFRLRIDNLTIPENAVVTVAEAYASSSERDSGAPFRLELRKSSGNTHQVRLVLEQGVGQPALTTDWDHIALTGTNVEIQWWAPRSANLPTGGARLWLGGGLRQEIKNAANFGQTVDSCRVGLIRPDPAILGFARIDTLQVWATPKQQ